VALKFGLKLGLKPIASAKTEFQTKLETELWFQTKVNPNNPAWNRTSGSWIYDNRQQNLSD